MPNGMLATLRHANNPNALASESWVTDTVGLPASRQFTHSNATPWTVTADWIWRGGSLLAMETPRGVRHLHLDHLGSPRLTTDRQGKKAAFHLYYPFGTEATSFNQDDLRAKFTGHERDLGLTTSAADDLDYMHARFYNGQLARFLSVDPLQGNPYQPQSMNRYAYVLGSPINFIDPWGLEEKEPQRRAPEPCSFTGQALNCTIDATGGNPAFDRIDASNPTKSGSPTWVSRDPGIRTRDFGWGEALHGLTLNLYLEFTIEATACMNGVELGRVNAVCESLGVIGGMETGAVNLLGRNAVRGTTRYLTDLPGGRPVAKSIFRWLTRNKTVNEEALGSGIGFRRFATDKSVSIRFNADGSTNLDVKIFGFLETIHFR